MANVTIDRAENVIVNQDGIAHTTGWVVLESSRIGGTPRLARGTGCYEKAKGCYVVNASAPEIPVSLPLSVDDFKRLTGWAQNA